MSQTFVGDTRVGVTVLQVGPCVVTQIKKEEKDGYWAVQIGFGQKKAKNTTKQLQGHLKNVVSEGKYPRFLREVRLQSEPEVKVGDVLNVSEVLKPGDFVTITATSKGKGFAGVVKRYKFKGGPRTHGQSNRPRSPGSIGQGTDPGRIWKGKRMAGRMGTETVTIKKLRVVSVDGEKGKIALSGSIPGPRGGFIVIKKTSEGKVEDLVEKAPEIQTKGKTGEVGVKEEVKEEVKK